MLSKIPDNVSLRDSSTCALGAIALHSTRRANLRIGETCIIVGTGAIGLITTQILVASGVRVLCIEIDETRLKAAENTGAEFCLSPKTDDIEETIFSWTKGNGADALIICASIHDDDYINNSFNYIRPKGKVVLVGTAPIKIKRDSIYPHEKDFLISTSYGPGRYDKKYEEEGLEYPIQYVRWTENRNMEEFLRLIQIGKVNLEYLNPKVIPIEKSPDLIETDEVKNSIISIIQYRPQSSAEPNTSRKELKLIKQSVNKKKLNVSVIGAGGFCQKTHLPNLLSKKDKFNIVSTWNQTPGKGIKPKEDFQAFYQEPNKTSAFSNEDIDLLFVTTQHSDHAKLAILALKNNKNIFLEKPLATSFKELEEIKSHYNSSGARLFVGFNRRFSEHTQIIQKKLKNKSGPIFINYTINAGFIPSDSWVHKSNGRLIGEMCHMVDLCLHLNKSKVKALHTSSPNFPSNSPYLNEDNIFCTLEFEDGSISQIQYVTNGSKCLEKESILISCDGISIKLKDFQNLTIYTSNGESNLNKNDKGHSQMLNFLYSTLSNDVDLFQSFYESTFVTLNLCTNSLKN